MTLDEAFGGLPDLRTGWRSGMIWREMILMALCAVLCGADTWVVVGGVGRGQRLLAAPVFGAAAWHLSYDTFTGLPDTGCRDVRTVFPELDCRTGRRG